MAPADEPWLGGTAISCGEAKQYLGLDPRTARRRVKAWLDLPPEKRPSTPTDTFLPGYIQRSGKKTLVYFYLPGGGPPAAAPSEPSLQAEVERLRAELVSSREANRLLEAAHAEMLDAAEDEKQAMQEIMGAVEHLQRAVSKQRSHSSHLGQALAHYTSALSQYTTPGDTSDLHV